MAFRKTVFLCVVVGVLLVLHGAESLHLKEARLYDGQGGNEFQRRIYHSPNVARNLPDSPAVARKTLHSPTVARKINPGPPPSDDQPYLDKLLSLVSRVNAQHAKEQKWRNLKVLTEQERKFMSHDDVEMNNQNAKEEENRETGSRAFKSDGVSYDGENFAKEDESMKHVDNFNLERKENKEGDADYEKEEEEEEQEEDDENEEQEEEEGEISAGKDGENNEDESSEELIEEKSKDKNKEDKKGEKSENKENAADDKRRLMTLLMRELKDLETEN
uniref:Uncharacterized protein n=1 Tax=Magallana gigas TaxID=29159 RepID=A0A8W8IWL4_MAGGI|nr:glutamic acid-rich protein isoform X2 [Crassostrea gigas]